MVGILPAAGRGSRLGPLPFSKELLPAWYPRSHPADAPPLPACRCCLQALSEAAIESTLVAVRAEKWDLARYLERCETELGIAMVLTGTTRGPVETLARVLPFAAEATVAFAFPDILFRASDPFGRLLDRLYERDADGVLGLFPPPRERTADRVSLDGDGNVVRILGAVRGSTGEPSWALAVWRPSLSDRILEYADGVTRAGADALQADDPRLQLGAALQAAVDGGLRLLGTRLSEETFCDVGETRGWIQALESGPPIGP